MEQDQDRPQDIPPGLREDIVNLIADALVAAYQRNQTGEPSRAEHAEQSTAPPVT